MVAIRRHFRGSRARVDAAAASVKADAIHACVIVDHCAVIYVVHVGDVHVVHAAVVEEMAAVPVAAFVAEAAVAETVVNAAVEADVRAPISGVPEISAATPTPVARRPQESDFRCDYPRAGDPIVAIRSVGPITRRPDVAISRAGRLHINRQLRRSDGDGDSKARRSGGRHGGWNGHENEREQQQTNDVNFTHDVLPPNETNPLLSLTLGPAGMTRATWLNTKDRRKSRSCR